MGPTIRIKVKEAAGLTILMGGDKWLEARLIHLLPQGGIDLTTRL